MHKYQKIGAKYHQKSIYAGYDCFEWDRHVNNLAVIYSNK